MTRWISLQEFNRMRDGVDDEFEAFDGALRAAGEADDERFADDRGEVAGQDGVRETFEAFQAHDFAEAGQFLRRRWRGWLRE